MREFNHYKNYARNFKNKFLADLEKGRHFFIKIMEEKIEEQEKQKKQKKKKLYSYLPISKRGDYKHQKELGFLEKIKAAVIGIDIKRYSKRNWTEQAFLSILLYSSIDKVIKCLQSNGIIDRDEPIIKQPTGDGALIVFDKRDNKKGHNNAIMNSLLFILIFNILIKEYNWQEIFETDEKNPIHPIYTRFSLDYGDLYLLIGLDDTLNCAGDTIVTSSRMLSIDKGNHFLVSNSFIWEIRSDINRFLSTTTVGDWKPEFSIIEMEPVEIKDKEFEISSIYGRYSDAPFLKLIEKSTKTPTSFTIGSSDTNQIISSK